jgi:hypothetical protein
LKLRSEDAMENWWSDVDDAVVECLETCGPLTPAEIGRRLALPESAVISLAGMLAREGRVQIRILSAPSRALNRTHPDECIVSA